MEDLGRVLDCWSCEAMKLGVLGGMDLVEWVGGSGSREWTGSWMALGAPSLGTCPGLPG